MVYRDREFRDSLVHYITVYLDRYGNDPALLHIQEDGKSIPVVGLMLEVGWRNPSGQPLSFDEDTNSYFRKWMKSSSHDLKQLNQKWGTSYKSFDEIDPLNKTIFNYAYADKKNMPMPVQAHEHFRARLISDAMEDIMYKVHKKHKDVLFAVEIAYPLDVDNQDAEVYRWNDANDDKAVENADMVFIRGVGTTTMSDQAKTQNLMELNGQRLVGAYRITDNTTEAGAAALALDCAMTVNGLACYNWNETADNTSAIYKSQGRQDAAKTMNSVYDMLYNVNLRHDLTGTQFSTTPPPTTSAPAAVPAATTAPPTAPVPAPVVKDDNGGTKPAVPIAEPLPNKPAQDRNGTSGIGSGQVAPAVPVPATPNK